MTLSESFVLVSFTLFSLADLRYRLVPGIELFFLGTILLTLPASPLQVGVVLFACIWGLLSETSSWLVIPLLFCPPTWPVLLIGYGYRKGMIGKADLLAVSSLACTFPLSAMVLSLLGLETWRRFWLCRRYGTIPVIPGLFLGLLMFIFLRLIILCE